MRRLLVSATLFALLTSTAPASATTCTPTALIRDGRVLAAAVVDPPAFSGALDAGGCDIGIYVSPAGNSTISSADIFNAVYFGVAVQTGTATVRNSSVHDVGDTPLSGAQHGVAIAYVEGASGTIDANTVWNYQKNGLLVNGAGTTATVTNNTVTGSGHTDRIAQNGIQISRGATATLTGNIVSDNIYTQNPGCAPECVGSSVGVIATGFLIFEAGAEYNTGDIARSNHAFRNQCNVCVFK